MAVRGAFAGTQTYNDTFVGWPLAPQEHAHGVYGTFLNPTTAWPSGMPPATVGYHKAIDIPVNDAHGPQPVIAIEGGRVHEAHRRTQVTPLGVTVRSGMVHAGHFKYAHVVPSVATGDSIVAGQQVGVTVPGWWHIHLEEYGQHSGRSVMLNPLRPGGKLGPVADPAPPVIHAMRIYRKADETSSRPLVLPTNAISGTVVPVALAMDPFPIPSWPGAPSVPLHVYRARIALDHDDGTPVVDRDLFQLDEAPGPFSHHFFRPLVRRSAPVAVCVVRKPADCSSRLWLRLWEQGLDTTRLPNGWYRLTLTVEDTVGLTASRELRFRIVN